MKTIQKAMRNVKKLTIKATDKNAVNPFGANIVAAYNGSLNITVKIDKYKIIFCYRVFESSGINLYLT